MEQKKAVGIWIRVSTDDQAKGESPEHHEKRARLYAESKDWEVRTVYHLEGLTGKSVMKYPETQRMLSDIRSGEISGLIFSKLARFARNTKELLEFADIFKQEKADLISLQEAIDTSSPAGMLFYTIIAAVAQWEREEIASRVQASIPIRAKLGKSLGGPMSLGYKWENKQVVIDEAHAPTRKLIYDMFLKLKRKKAVARYLNDNGYRTREGRKFSDTTIKQLIQDPTAKGLRRANYCMKDPVKKYFVMKPESEWVWVQCPAIVSAETWDECNRILNESLLKNKRPGPTVKHLLAGYVHCEQCGKKMYVHHMTKAPVYRCAPCGIRIQTQDLEEIYHDQLKAFLLTDTSISEYLQKIDSELQQRQKLLSARLQERDALNKKMDNFIHMRMNNELSKEVFAEKYKPLEEQLTQLNNLLPDLQAEIDFLKIQHQSSDVVLNDAKDLHARWNSLDLEAKRTIVETITEKITLGKEDIHIKLAYLPTNHPTHPPINNSNPNSGKKQLNHWGLWLH